MKKLVLVGILLFSMVGLFAISHMVYVQGNDAVGEVSFSAWITTRPAEVLTNASGNCDWDEQFAGHISVQCESFATPWAIGETIHIEATDGAGNVMNDADGGGNEYVELVLTSEPYDWVGAYFMGGDLQLENSVINISSVEAEYGETFGIAISTTELLEDWNVTAFQFNLSFDGSVMQYSGYDIDDLMTYGGMVAINDNENDVITVGYAGTASCVGAGDIIILEFLAVANGTTTLEITNFAFNATSIENTNLGYVTVTGAPDNVAPIADAGVDQIISDLQETCNLDGTDSYDPDGDAITYLWTGDIDLTNPTSATPSFPVPVVTEDTD